MKIISLRTALFFTVAVFSFVLGNAQNLTISTSGQTTSPGTNWSISGNVLNVAASGSAEIHPSVITNHLLNTGNLTINLPWQSGVGRNVNINASIAYTGSAARTLTINCANDIVFANAVGITSATASLNVVLRSAIGLSLGAPDHGLVKMDGINIDTKGGNLWVGGGTTSTSWNGLTVGNSYAVTWLDDVSGISLIGSTLNTAGGHIALYAQSFNSGDDDGTNYGINVENSNISSGSGSIYMAGGLYGKYTVGIGMRIFGTTSTSISSSTGAIYIYGYGSDATSVGNSWRNAVMVNGTVSIKSTAGSITMFGEAAFASAVNDKEGLILGAGVVVASQTGSILLKGTNTLESSGQYSNSIRFAAANVPNSIRVGYDGTNAYSGNITIEGNSIYQRSTHSGAGSIAVQTTGTLTIQPTGNAFTYMRAGDSGTLSYDDDWNFGTTLGGFVYGKTTNNANISFANNLSVAGPIQILGGIVTINANLTSSANGDIFIKGISTNNPSIMVGSGKTIHKSAGTGTLTVQGHSRVQNSGSITATGTGVLNVVMWSDFDNSNNDGGVSHVGNISTKGGHVWLGGSNTNGGSYSWNGLTVGDGPSIGSSGYNANALDIFGNITTLGGDFLAWAGNGVSGGVNGLATSTGYSINVGSGDIVLITDEILGTGPSLFFNQSGGSFTLVPNDGDFGTAFNWDGTTNAVAGYGTGWNFGGNFNYLWLENPSSLTSLTIGKYDGMLNGSTPVVLTNSSNVVFSNTTATSIAGPIGIHGGDITISQNLTSSLLNAAIFLQATGRIEVSAAKTIQTSGGNITLRSNSSGVAVVTPNVTTGSITLNSGSSLLSNGGNITLGGNYSGTQGQGLYAASNRIGGSPGIVINNATLTAAGGNINIYGKCTSSYDDGVRLQATITTTGAGNIGIYGDAWGGYNGTEFFGGISFFNEISRIETENGDVTLEGILTNSSHAQGYALSFYRSTGLTGQSKHIQILSKTGDIQISANPGTSIGKGIGHSSWGNIYFGSPSNNNYIATGSIKFIYSSLVNAANNGFKVKTSGPVTYEPIANSFVADQDFPSNTNYVLAEGASSLTIGKAVNTANIYLQEPISIPGSITVYGGNLYLYNDIASTGGGNISLLGASSVYTSGLASITRDLTTSGGTIRVEGDSDADGTGLLNIDYMSFNPGSGNTILRGELFSFETTSETIKPNINGTGTFTLESNDLGFGQNIALSWFKIANTITGVTVGKQTSNTFTYLNSTNGLTINGPVTINGSSIEISTPLSLTNNLSLRASGAVTQTLAGTINSVGLALNGTGTVTLTNESNNFVTIAGGAVGALIGATQIIDASGGLTIGTVGSNSGLLGSSTIRVETLAGNLTLAENISTTNTSTDAVILTAAKSTAIGTPTGGDILVTGSPTITLGTGGIAKLYSGYDMTSTGLSTFVGSSNVRYNYDETSTTINPALSANNKYAFYRTGQGYGDLNIVSTAGDAEGSTWSYANGVITTISGTANVSNTAIQNKLNSGNLSIEANKITFSANITGTTSNSLSILSKTHIVNTNATTITTLGGDVLFASNVDDATDNENTVNGYIVLTSGLTMNTGGGDITFGGGNNLGTDYALGASVYPFEGIRFDGIINLNSGGGNISMRGKSYAIATTAGAWGVGFWNLSTGLISSGIGAITLDGFSQSSGGTHNAGLYSHGALTITSENTTADAIRLIGKCTGTSGEAWGIEAESALSVLTNGTGGGITITTSKQLTDNYDAVFRGETNLLASTGPIQIQTGQLGGTPNGYLYLGGFMYLGSKASTAVTASSSNINIQVDRFHYDNGAVPRIATLGSVTIQPNSTSFGMDIYSSYFNFNQNGHTMTNFNFGKSGNAGNLYLNSDFTVAGPINVYGGYVQVSSMITSSADGDLLLKGLTNSNLSVALTSGGISKTAGIGTILMQGHGRVQNNGAISATGTGILNLVLWSDYDGDNVGGGSTLGAGGSISTNGGHVWIGGSSSNGGTYTWNGLSVGDGPSVGASGCNCNAIDLFGPITTGGGDVLLWAGNNGGCGTNGIQTDGTRLINVGNGDIALIADQTGGNVELTSTGVISLLPHAGGYASALTLGGTTTSGHFTFNTSHYNGLKINSLATTGLVIGQYAGHSSATAAVIQGNTSTVTASTALSTKSLGIYGGSVITSAALTAAGNIILDADNGNFLSQNTKGVEVNAALTTTNNGNITLHGRGGSTTGVQTHGINVTNLIDAGGTGNIELIGYGGLSFDNATGSSCHGVNIEGANAWVKSNGGNVVINGYGGGAGAGTYSQGVPLLTNAKVSAAGSGTVTITGTGGVNTAIGLRGVVLTSGSSVYSSGGAITITGVAGTYGSDNSDGISMETATIGNTSTGSILLSGQAGGGTGSEAISMNGTNTIGAASHNNTIVLRGNNLSIAGTNSVLTTGQVTIEPHSTSFSNALSFPIANLSIASTITGLTLGKSSNSSAITLTTAANINGPINIYGGAVALNGNLTTLNNTTGDILIKANTLSGTPAISVANNRSLTFDLAQSTTISGSVTGTNINLIKTGVGTLGFGSTLPSSANVITQAGTLQFTSNQSVADVEMNGGTLIIDDTKKLTINEDFTALAAGTLQNNGTIELVGPESFPGLNTNISAMKNLEVNRSAGVLLNNALTLTGALTLTSGVLDLNNNTLTHAGTTLTKTNGKIDASTGVLAFANDQTALTLPTGLFVPDALTGVAEVAEIFKSAGAATVTINDDLMVTGALRTAASTGALVLGIGTELNLNGNFINNGAITFDTLATVLQGASSQASGTGVYNVRQKVTGSSANGQANGRFWYLGSAVANAQASAVMTANANKIYHWEANQASPSWIELTDANAVLQTGKGYSIRMGDQSVLNFSGSAMHNNTLQIPSYRQTTGSFQGYNLITNPYLSYLDWEMVWQGSNAVNFQPTIWYRLANNTNVMVFDTYNAQSNIGTSNNSANGSTSVTRYIPPMQAVWMRLNTGVSSANLMVDNSARSHYTAVQGGLTAGLKTTAQDFPAFVRLNLIQGAFQDQTIVYLKDAAAASYDNFDSDKMFLTGYPQVYSQVAGKKLVINGLKDNKKVTVVPLFIDIPAAGNYTFKASELNIENGLILLEDKLEGVLQDLTINDTYQFAAASGTTSNRFYLRIILPNSQPIAQGPTSNWVNEEVTYTEGGTILVSSDGAGRVMVTQQVTEDASGIVLVRDAAGRLVFEGETQGAQTIFTLEQPSGLYFVEVQIGNTSKIEKIVLR